MILTFRHLYEQVAAQQDERTGTGTTRDLVKEYLNQAHALRCTEYAQQFLIWEQEETLTTVPGTRVYTLHQLVDKPLYFFNRTANQWLKETPNRTLTPDEYSFSAVQSASARNFMFWGHSAVKAQPTAASVVTIVSTSALDTGATYQVGVKGINASSELVVDVVTLTGTTPAATTTAFVTVLAVTKGKAFNGTMTATANSGAVSLLSLSPTEFGREYRRIYLIENPPTAETIGYRFYRKPLYLTNDYDIPEIPAPYSQILVWDALLLMAAYNTDVNEKSIAIWQQAQQRWERALAAYVADSQTLQSRSQYVNETESQFIFGGRAED